VHATSATANGIAPATAIASRDGRHRIANASGIAKSRLLGRMQTLIAKAAPARAWRAGRRHNANTIAARVHIVAKTSLIGCDDMKMNTGQAARMTLAATLCHSDRPN